MGSLDIFEEVMGWKNVFVGNEKGVDLYMRATDGRLQSRLLSIL